jgi:maleylacetate reductase
VSNTLLPDQFEISVTPTQVVFAEGAINRTSEMIDSLGCSRALVLSTPEQVDQATQLAESLGAKAVGVYNNATMHTPVQVTQDALLVYEKCSADCTIAIGGGSTVGLGKAISHRIAQPQIVIPTTYAGSEVTPILGQTENNQKTTIRDAALQPDIVIYDPELTYGLPQAMTMTSGLNAIAHAVEALYAKDRNPVSSLMAIEGVRALVEGLPAIQLNASSIQGRRKALYGAWLCGSVLGSVGMALHHKLCHTLGGMFDLPHAQTHAVVLPHALAFNEFAVPELLSPIAAHLESDTAASGLFNLSQSVGAPVTLEELGMPSSGIEAAAQNAVKNAYWNPRDFNQKQIQQLIENAFYGRHPQQLT